MNPLFAAAIVVGLIAASTALGLWTRRRTGRVHVTRGRDRITPADVGSELPFGTTATLLQFSTEFCAPCRAASRVLGAAADQRVGLEHREVDLALRPDLATRFGILQTPTTLVLDAHGEQLARISGAPRAADFDAQLNALLGDTNAHA